MLAGMENTARLFVLSFLPACGIVTLDGVPPDAQPPDASGPGPDARLDGVLDGGPAPDALSCPPFSFSDLPPGAIGEMALVQDLGTLTAERCVDGTCEARQLYASDFGLGVDGTLIDGDEIEGIERVTLSLPAPARVSYRVHRGVNNDLDLGVHHRISAYRDGKQVLDMTIEGREYDMSPMPPADVVIWSGALPPGPDPEFADGVTLEWASACPTVTSRAPARSGSSF